MLPNTTSLKALAPAMPPSAVPPNSRYRTFSRPRTMRTASRANPLAGKMRGEAVDSSGDCRCRPENDRATLQEIWNDYMENF